MFTRILRKLVAFKETDQYLLNSETTNVQEIIIITILLYFLFYILPYDYFSLDFFLMLTNE